MVRFAAEVTDGHLQRVCVEKKAYSSEEKIILESDLLGSEEGGLSFVEASL